MRSKNVAILDLELDFNATDEHGNTGAIWLSDEFHGKLNLMHASKSTIKDQMCTWTRRAILAALQERCIEIVDEVGNVTCERKDMVDIPR